MLCGDVGWMVDYLATGGRTNPAPNLFMPTFQPIRKIHSHRFDSLISSDRLNISGICRLIRMVF